MHSLSSNYGPKPVSIFTILTPTLNPDCKGYRRGLNRLHKPAVTCVYASHYHHLQVTFLPTCRSRDVITTILVIILSPRGAETNICLSLHQSERGSFGRAQVSVRVTQVSCRHHTGATSRQVTGKDYWQGELLFRRWRHYVSWKRSYVSTDIHSVISPKTLPPRERKFHIFLGVLCNFPVVLYNFTIVLYIFPAVLPTFPVDLYNFPLDLPNFPLVLYNFPVDLRSL
jgi:hypothetical protein